MCAIHRMEMDLCSPFLNCGHTFGRKWPYFSVIRTSAHVSGQKLFTFQVIYQLYNQRVEAVAWQKPEELLLYYTSYFLHIISIFLIFLPIHALHCQHMLDTGCSSP